MLDFWKQQSSHYGQAQDLEEIIRELVARYVQQYAISRPDSTLLELGCGNGAVLVKIEKLNLPIVSTGVDYSSSMLEVAQQRLFKTRLVEADLLPFLAQLDPTKKFNITLCINTLHNLPSRDSIQIALHALAQATTPGGFIMFDLRNPHNPFLSRGYRSNRKKGLQFFTFPLTQAKKILKQEGFEVVTVQPIFYKTLQEAGRESRSFLKSWAYRIYLYLTRTRLLSTYLFVVARKKP
jgi:ubiquinone/menaquinone biosynthesis C-methylase UbiE